jgi:hypothetical protein
MPGDFMDTSVVNYLKEVMPGQPDAWYQRIAGDVIMGKMPLPKVEGVPAPKALPIPTVNAARQRFLDGSKRQSPPEPVKPPVKPKSKTQQLKRGTYRSVIPNTVNEAIQQVSQKPKRPAQPANAATKRKLAGLTHGDNATAARLAAQVAFINPGKSEQWCWEKAIFDLERDRH